MQINDPVQRFLLRQQAAGRLPGAFLSHAPLSAYEGRRYLDSLAVQVDDLPPLDRTLLARFRGEQPGPGAAWMQQRFPFLYANGTDFLSVAGDGYALQFSPLLYLTAGRARRTTRDDRDPALWVWQNTRGVRAAGHIGPYLFFETRLEENQRRDVEPIFTSSTTAPRLGFTKRANEDVFDYFVATGVLGVRTRFIEARFGRDRNQWGYGASSLLLSNYATVYDQLQIRTTVWRLQYTNLFMGLAEPRARISTTVPGQTGDDVIPRKYAAFHRLAINLPKRIQLELFESIIFATDTLGARKGFDLSYLNPVVFYRSVEHDRGSPDNALLGVGASWVAVPGLQLYSQFLLDELSVSNIGKGWWANKWGWLAGLHVAEWPLPGLSVRLEYARLRPYLYSHRNALNAFIHFDDLLGHPAGPNAEDVALFVDYQPTPRLRAALNLAFTRRGRNTDTQNFGSDPLLTYTTFVSEFDNKILQGVRQNRWLAEAYAGYELLPSLFLEAALRAESVDDAELGLDRYLAPYVMLRWGLPFQSMRY